MKTRLLLVTLFAAFTFTANAQSDYKSSIGLRAGSGYYDRIAVSYKTFISAPAALEFNVGFTSNTTARILGVNWGWTSVSVAGAYQHHFDIPNVDGLKWFVGGGAVVYGTFSDWDEYKGFGVGLFPTGGADYKIKNIPLNVSVDIRPTFHIDNLRQHGAFSPNAGVSARYVF